MGRLRIRILNQNDVVTLVNALNTWTDKFILESEDGMYRVNAKSVLDATSYQRGLAEL